MRPSDLPDEHSIEEVRLLAEQMADAVEPSRLIGRAQGLLMERESCTSDEAFELLRKWSQNTNVRIVELAWQLVAAQDAAAKRRTADRDQRTG